MTRLILHICAAIVLAGFLCSSSSAQLKLTATDDGLKGPVRTTQTTSFNLRWDAARNKYLEDGSSANGASYDRQGRKTSQYSGYQKEDASVAGKEIFVYDSAGRLLEIDEYNSDGKMENKSIVSHDEQGRLISIVGSFRFKASLFSGDGPPMEVKMSITYSANGKTEEITIGDASKELPTLFRTVTTFGQNGNLLTQQLYAVDALESEQTYIYDAQGRLVKMRETKPKERGAAEELYSYDAHGNLIETRRYGRRHAMERKTLLTYEFDAHGNWVTAAASGWVYTGNGPYRKGVSKITPVAITRRVITYWE